jgi:hypothetical protein
MSNKFIRFRYQVKNRKSIGLIGRRQQVKKIAIFWIILITLSSLSWAESPPGDLNVGNTGPIPVTMDEADVTVVNDKDNPVPVTVTDKDQRKPMSEFYTYRLEGSGRKIKDFEVMEVPEGKIFVLTDMLALEHDGSNSLVIFSLIEDSTLKYSDGTVIHFDLITGVVFAAGSRVLVRLTYTADQAEGAYSEGSIFVSGYLAKE